MRVQDWLRQAAHDLDVAKSTRDAGHAEKALKALYQHVQHLLDAEPGLAELREPAKLLNKFYLPTRYANGLEAGAPASPHARHDPWIAALDRQVTWLE